MALYRWISQEEMRVVLQDYINRRLAATASVEGRKDNPVITVESVVPCGLDSFSVFVRVAGGKGDE